MASWAFLSNARVFKEESYTDLDRGEDFRNDGGTEKVVSVLTWLLGQMKECGRTRTPYEDTCA